MTVKENEAALYYLYMMSDGKITHNEEIMFDRICDELELPEEYKQSAITRCKEITSDGSEIFEVIKRERIDEKTGNIFDLGWTFYSNESSQARVIWNLIDLGYADRFYSDEEKQIVNYFIQKWDIKEDVVAEMLDTAETMLALIKQKEWVYATFKEDQECDERIKKIDSEIDRMYADIKLTIKELTM